MNRPVYRLALVACLAGFLVVLSAGAAYAPPQAPHDSARGHGLSFDGNRFAFRAVSDTDGTNASGRMRINATVIPAAPGEFFKARAVVTCLDVQGTTNDGTAVIGGNIFRNDSSPAFQGFDGMIFFVFDNGRPGRGLDVWQAIPTSVAPSTCPPVGTALGPIQRGEIVVHNE